MAGIQFKPEGVAGHLEQIKLLEGSLNSDRTANAYLFFGPEGIGKKLLAMNYITALFCSSKEQIPCGHCPGCKKMHAGSHADFYMIEQEEGRKFIRIEQVRELRSSLALKSFEGGWKAVVIDQAEIMNDAAQNCLLKTLEEPPGDTVIALIAGGGGGRLLPTIISRCQIIRMSPLKPEDISGLIAEKLEIDHERAELLARLSDGSVGKALNMDLDFIFDLRPEIIDKTARFAMPGTNKAEGMLELTDMILYNNSMGLVPILEWIRAFFRDAALAKAYPKEISNADVSDIISELGSSLSFPELAEKFDAAEEALNALKRNQNKEFTIEMMLMKIQGVTN